ncbi:unnamed protein product [Strongylus vulgaris]|uniref:Uncharacterized protein n=1 Tax=Strongylus vulgaris TaxID=40348 RepID=A0A3P7HYW3_STRVU|nr:unnamed protein product [Strongylus vulgaris]
MPLGVLSKLDHLKAIGIITEKTLGYYSPVALVFIDFKKTFDMIIAQHDCNDSEALDALNTYVYKAKGCHQTISDHEQNQQASPWHKELWKMRAFLTENGIGAWLSSARPKIFTMNSVHYEAIALKRWTPPTSRHFGKEKQNAMGRRHRRNCGDAQPLNVNEQRKARIHAYGDDSNIHMQFES